MHVIRETNLTTMAERNIIVCVPVQLFHRRQAMRSLACAAWDTHHHSKEPKSKLVDTQVDTTPDGPDCTPPRQSHVRC